MDRDKPMRVRLKEVATKFVSNPLARLLLALHISPNSVTVTGFLVACFGAYLIAQGELFWGGIVMLSGSALDMLDGAMARMSGRVTAYGAFLDSVMDRLSESAILFGLLVFFTREASHLEAYLTFGTLTVSLLVSYLRARAEGLGISGDVGLMSRPERVIVIGLGLLVGYPEYALLLVFILGTATTFQRAWHVRRNFKA